MVVFSNKLKKYDKIQLTKNKMDWDNRKMNNHAPSPENLIKYNNNSNKQITSAQWN